jgi:hypothetical protein
MKPHSTLRMDWRVIQDHMPYSDNSKFNYSVGTNGNGLLSDLWRYLPYP